MEILEQRLNQVNWWNKWHQSFEVFQEQMKMKIEEISQEKADLTKLQRCTDEMEMLLAEVIQTRDIQNCGEFLWCIDNWKDKLERGRNGINKFICSDPFYSHRNGYKMRLRLGFGISSLYLYLQILRGEFDNILQWPFRHEVKFDLINQETGLPHSSRILKTTGNPNWDGWKKPTTGENEGIGFHFGYLPNLFRNTAVSKDNQILFSATPKISP